MAAANAEGIAAHSNRRAPGVSDARALAFEERMLAVGREKNEDATEAEILDVREPCTSCAGLAPTSRSRPSNAP